MKIHIVGAGKLAPLQKRKIGTSTYISEIKLISLAKACILWKLFCDTEYLIIGGPVLIHLRGTEVQWTASMAHCLSERNLQVSYPAKTTLKRVHHNPRSKAVIGIIVCVKLI
jgi:hypothetical protein